MHHIYPILYISNNTFRNTLIINILNLTNSSNWYLIDNKIQEIEPTRRFLHVMQVPFLFFSKYTSIRPNCIPAQPT